MCWLRLSPLLVGSQKKLLYDGESVKFGLESQRVCKNGGIRGGLDYTHLRSSSVSSFIFTTALHIPINHVTNTHISNFNPNFNFYVCKSQLPTLPAADCSDAGRRDKEVASLLPATTMRCGIQRASFLHMMDLLLYTIDRIKISLLVSISSHPIECHPILLKLSTRRLKVAGPSSNSTLASWLTALRCVVDLWVGRCQTKTKPFHLGKLMVNDPATLLYSSLCKRCS